MSHRFSALIISLAVAGSLSADSKSRQVVIRTDDKGNVLEIQGVKPSRISVDSLGIILDTREGISRAVVLSKQVPNSTLDLTAIAKKTEAADPYALKLIIRPNGVLGEARGAKGKPASGPGMPGGAGMSVSAGGSPFEASADVSPVATRIRIVLTAPGALKNFAKKFGTTKKH